ncbi:MAG: hypothetical protein ACKOPR_11220 [Chakrabartia godavariana]
MVRAAAYPVSSAAAPAKPAHGVAGEWMTDAPACWLGNWGRTCGC